MTTPGRRDLIRMGAIVVAGTAFGVGAISQWAPPPDVHWIVGPTQWRCTEKVSPGFFQAGLLKNSTSKNINVVAVKTTGSSAALRVVRFYVTTPKDAGTVALGGSQDPKDASSPDNHILIPHHLHLPLMVDFSNDHINGHATQLQVTLKNDGETSTHTYPIDITFGGAAYNPSCNK